MIDYWAKLKLDECWSKRQRFNIVMAYINGELSETTDEPTVEQPTGEQPTGEQPTGEQPTGEQPTGEQPTGEQPTGEQPTGEQPTEEQPTVEETVDIEVSVKNAEESGVEGVVVNLTQNNEIKFTGTTGSAGGCNLRTVALGDYVVQAVKEGYADYNDELSVTNETNSISIVLTQSQ